ncbi:hypothetical protein BDV23DRAFT_143390 [Aspergillus alliaceus]|uniref:Uncharacterized protein n=1 Tax=Petromyces alliaceus TaxID=209559 RepID=A0A5N7CSZ9_PETAA|nr:uncharacterized protein BDW43DRAFT_275730 [Aspergillus alliaceus]KAB8233648.1 hypothetical protein BDW43DRAFT_275730 [Aspergillus alliaceus]KAE8396693.1 hypothetical protein BDV23DRAFT_143390 [Aspergillus alliaceus]
MSSLQVATLQTLSMPSMTFPCRSGTVGRLHAYSVLYKITNSTWYCMYVPLGEGCLIWWMPKEKIWIYHCNRN